MIDVTLVEAADRLLGTFSTSPPAGRCARSTRRGVTVVLGTGVDHLTADGVHLADGRFLPARTVVWAAGVTAGPVAAESGLDRTRGGRLVVGPDLSVPGRPEVFAIGDIAAAAGDDGQPLAPGGAARHPAAGRTASIRPPIRRGDRGSPPRSHRRSRHWDGRGPIAQSTMPPAAQ